MRIRWGGTPRQEDLTRIRSLHLRPTHAQLRKPALPAFLPDLVNLQSMVVPTPLVPHLASSGLASLVVSHDHKYPIPALRHLELVDLKNIDIFDHVRAPLRALEIGGTGRDFPIAKLASLKTLRALRLNGVGAQVDCAVFRDLPELVDLAVLNTRKITNIEALLDCPRLTSIMFVNCGNPFKKDGKALFRTKGFARLDIDYS